MTEAEAKTKRCCGPETCGNLQGHITARYCIGASCMAWQWLAGEEGRFYRQRKSETVEPMQGDCGLKP